MSYRRRQTSCAGLAEPLSQAEGLAALQRMVELSRGAADGLE
jgi:hypothetical protein